MGSAAGYGNNNGGMGTYGAGGQGYGLAGGKGLGTPGGGSVHSMQSHAAPGGGYAPSPTMGSMGGNQMGAMNNSRSGTPLQQAPLQQQQPQSNYVSAPSTQATMPSQSAPSAMPSSLTSNPNMTVVPGGPSTAVGQTATGGQQAISNQKLPFDMKASFSYTASPDDPNEISFVKGEILTILDNSGKWFSARKMDGQEGIVPR